MATSTRSKDHGAVRLQEPVDTQASPSADKVQSPPKGNATEKIDPDFEKDVAIGEFIGHRVDTENSTVGYRPAESTWEHESKLRTITPDKLERFETKQLASGASEKRKSMRGPGRPRKKPRVED
ncbi:hypothetical protein BFJ63_vAg16493 [Fusarium oxysporum f. sp. narcissi]|uniref:Chromo domain-containing protein n=1 Tax=Fusarium oxysporum f. sp. narcissi TaxID=451672 RepID=A0A4Q2V177_FUSOX|nr:hypothetical protein BFJ63_vAg16493 [Fusarium oxysporum f. sp. narcissi]